jgi:hypothetical protein
MKLRYRAENDFYIAHALEQPFSNRPAVLVPDHILSVKALEEISPVLWNLPERR